MNLFSNKNWVGALIAGGLLLVTTPFRASGQPGQWKIRRISSVSSTWKCLFIRRWRVRGASRPRCPVKVLLSDQATLQSIDISIQEKAVNLVGFFKESVEGPSRTPAFRRPAAGDDHAGLSLRGPSNESNGSLFAFEPPNHFWIRSGAVRLNP